jgi:hypothetical protein
LAFRVPVRQYLRGTQRHDDTDYQRAAFRRISSTRNRQRAVPISPADRIFDLCPFGWTRPERASRRRVRWDTFSERAAPGLENCVRFVDEMHVRQIGRQLHRLPRRTGGVRIDPCTNLFAVDPEVNHGLHPHRLHHVRSDGEFETLATILPTRFGDVLRSQAERQLLAEVRPVTAAAATGNASASVKRTCNPVPASSSLQRRKFIAGDPMKPATKRVLGLW